VACSSEIAFIREALPDATIERVQHIASGGHMCAYHVRQHRDVGREAQEDTTPPV
jgi:predicted ArsR family transcriptional regulator